MINCELPLGISPRLMNFRRLRWNTQNAAVRKKEGIWGGFREGRWLALSRKLLLIPRRDK